MRELSGKDSSKTYAQKRWEFDVAEYERNKVSLEKYKAMLECNYSEASKKYINDRIKYVTARQETIRQKYPRHKFD